VSILQRRAPLLLIGPVAVLALLAGLTLVAGDRQGPPAACAEPQARDLPGEAVELTAGKGVWSAWITYPAVARETITVLWRVEGFVPGDLRLAGSDRLGHRLAVEFGPSPVIPQLRGGGLLWPRIGREWGSHVRFSHPGCWLLDVTAGDKRGVLALWVRR
jgi:hypothetical protein